MILDEISAGLTTACIHSDPWPAQYHAFGLRIPQSGLDALADQIALQKKERTVRTYFLLDSLGKTALIS